MQLNYVETKGWYFRCGDQNYSIPIKIRDRRRAVVMGCPGIKDYKIRMSMLLFVCQSFIEHKSSRHSGLRLHVPVILWFCFINKLNFEVTNMSGGTFISLKPKVLG